MAGKRGNAAPKVISPEVREKMRAAGRKSIPLLLDYRRNAPNTRTVSTEFEQSLLGEIEGTPTPLQRGLILSATASYTAVFLVLLKLRTAHRYNRVEALLAQLGPQQNALHRALRLLGTKHAPKVETLEELLARPHGDDDADAEPPEDMSDEEELETAD